MTAARPVKRGAGEHAYFGGGLPEMEAGEMKAYLRRAFRLRFPGLQTLPWT